MYGLSSYYYACFFIPILYFMLFFFLWWWPANISLLMLEVYYQISPNIKIHVIYDNKVRQHGAY